MEELPVFDKGCDSSYSWSKRFSHLAHKDTAEDIVKIIENNLPGNKFQNPKTKQWQHMAFTGGEPMLNQEAIVDVLNEFEKNNNFPKFVTIETNGTQMPKPYFIEMVKKYFPLESDKNSKELFWSVSPKLFLSGEKWEKAIKPEVIKAYYDLSHEGQLKYVCDGSDRAWEEVEKATKLYREFGVDWDVWIMPVGATKEEQENIQAKITEEAVNRGYYVSARVHTWIFGNAIGK